MAYLGVWQNAKALCNFDGLGSCGSYVYLEVMYNNFNLSRYF